ncbi:NADH-quinone oxidoreductase subunit B family protein [Thermococcus sp. AM4]|uniref:NADH-quinone oxidoreductase subunit B family protein n=1 Tax=Thermococcus sp. (strain AM4) TaxID=246969 RepID=UPI000187073B|nr:NADH ubiquinone oxidoreductase [Thermococcus sp. AM4]EEB72980.1 Subunit MbhJ of mbhHM(K+L)NJBCD(E+F)GAH'-encoded membrane-bound energy-converting [Ni,Fe]-hydrogenase [Thermococcus sp. AM4]
MIKKSLWVFHLNSGSCNGCDIEVLNMFAPRNDVERLGIKLVGSPRHADAIAFTGPITRECLPKVIDALTAVPDPKVVLAIGACACGGGIWYDTYSVIGGIKELYKILKEEYNIEPPATVFIPGCPPKPEAIIYGVAVARGMLEKKQRKQVYIEPEESVAEEKIRLASLLMEAEKTRHFLPKLEVRRV